MTYHCEVVFNYREVIKELIRLALNREKALTISNQRDKETVINLGDISMELTNEEKELSEFIGRLDFEVIKVIQTVMYIGRDGTKWDTPYDIYSNERKDMDDRGWNSKEIEANHMESKMPLGSYLINGLGILQIQLQ